MNTQDIFKWMVAAVGSVVAVIVIAVVSGWIYGVEKPEVAEVAEPPHEEAEVAEAVEPAPAPEAMADALPPPALVPSKFSMCSSRRATPRASVSLR